MSQTSKAGISSGRLDPLSYVENFSDLHPPLSPNKAKIESDRCYFCHDAPCMEACPTSIDIPLFIREISTDNPDGAADTIFKSNILGGMCARVCPTETLCEEVCVHVEQGNLPVKIGELQRFATDHAMETYGQTGGVKFSRAASTGKRICVVGAGPAGLACAHRLASNGHDVTILEAKEKSGGLNEYGLAAYKTTNDFAQNEVEFVLSIGGITIEHGKALGKDVSVSELTSAYDAVFLGLGLDNTNGLGLDGEDLAGVYDAVDYISDIRQADNLADLDVGQQVVVIGGGMTAIDVAVQVKKLGARDVTIAYRRGPDQMGASAFECELAQTNGVVIQHWAAPVELSGDDEKVRYITLARTQLNDAGKLENTGDTFTLACDQVFKAIGQTFDPSAILGAEIELEARRIKIDDDGKTSLEKVWAGGDCVAGGDDLTVSSVEDGNVAAASIDAFLQANS